MEKVQFLSKNPKLLPNTNISYEWDSWDSKVSHFPTMILNFVSLGNLVKPYGDW